MNIERAAWSILAGFVAVASTFVATVVWFYAVFFDLGGAVPGTVKQPGPSFYPVVYAIEAILMVVAGAAPALALGAGWARSFLIPAVVFALLGLPALMVAGMSGRALTLALVVGVALVELAALILGGGANSTGLLALVAVTATLLVVVWGFFRGRRGRLLCGVERLDRPAGRRGAVPLTTGNVQQGKLGVRRVAAS